MDDQARLTRRFEDNRTRLRAVAYRMLGSRSEADDAVQETWLRLNRSETGDVENLSGWLTTVIARVCLDMLRSRKSRREEPLETHASGAVLTPDHATDPEHVLLQTESVGLALLVVLDTLGPAERVAYVLHDLFDVNFDEIAPIVGRTPAAARQLASRARRRVQGAAITPTADHTRQREAVTAFRAAARGGDFAALLAVLDPDVVLRADPTAVRLGAMGETRGAEGVAKTFLGRAQAAQSVLVDGAAGLVWAVHGRPRVVFFFTMARGKIAAIDLVGDPDRLARLDLMIVPD